MKYIFILLAVFFTQCNFQKKEDSYSDEIESLMLAQEKAWNNFDVEEYMKAYWNSDSLRFIGSKGLTFGWETTLDNYKNGYSDSSAMGRLQFDIMSIEKLEKNHVLVIGKWTIFRNDTISGHYTLIWKKINGEWKIVLDHTS
jgi:ketosteroid isomerase-like protein